MAIHEHLGGPDAKRGPLKVLTPLLGDLEKISTNFPGKIKFYDFLWGWP